MSVLIAGFGVLGAVAPFVFDTFYSHTDSIIRHALAEYRYERKRHVSSKQARDDLLKTFLDESL